MEQKHLIFVFGTRPEAIKLAPLIIHAKDRAYKFDVCFTGQHPDMVTPILDFFEIEVDHSFTLTNGKQSTEDFIHDCGRFIDGILEQCVYRYLIVQGDTMSVLAGALSAFRKKVEIVHVEAGLRSNNLKSPFPEEGIRQMVSRIASINFAPTSSAVRNLLAEGVNSARIHNVGNTVTDAIRLALLRSESYVRQDLFELKGDLVLFTAHRRENFGENLRGIFDSLRLLALKHDVSIIFPVHLNPLVRDDAYEILSNVPNVFLLEPLVYPELIWLINRSKFVITDSGGIQEEAVSLGKMVIVLRDETEREEGVEVGLATLVGTDGMKFRARFRILMSTAVSSGVSQVYGDGFVSQRILNII